MSQCINYPTAQLVLNKSKKSRGVFADEAQQGVGQGTLQD